MSRIHVCLVSEQTLPNLIPMRMEGHRPDCVVFLESQDMRNVADRLEEIIKPWGIKVERRGIEPFDYSLAQDACLDALAGLEGHEITLNVTGGTKLMAFAAFDVFKDGDVIYVDTQNGKLYHIGKKSSEKISIGNIIDVKLYLKAYGRSIRRDGTDRSRVEKNRPVFKSIVESLPEFGKAVSDMNRLIRVENRLGDFDNKNSVYPYEIKVDQNIRSNHGFEKMLNLLSENGIIKSAPDGFILPTQEAADFSAGGWLEEYAYDTAASIISSNNIMMDIEVEYAKRGSKSVKNQHDVVFAHSNQLYIIECKTGNLDRAGGRDKAGTDAIYKLDSLRDSVGGVYGKGMIVSYRELNSDQKRRATANKLAYCDGPNLKNLSQKIKEWIRK